MKAIKSKLLACILAFTMFLGCIPSNVYASVNSTVETYEVKEFGVVYEKIIMEDKTIMNIKSLDGVIIHTLMDYNGSTYLDGDVISVNKNNCVNIPDVLPAPPLKSDTISWGSWQTNTIATIDTGGLPAAIIYGLIALYAGWCGIGIISSVAAATAGTYDELEIKVKMRYGTDDKYLHYQRYTYFYGDGKLIPDLGLNVNPFYDTGKTSLD